MDGTTLAYIAGGLCIAWGIAHLAATRMVIEDFEPLLPYNRRTITMAWIGGGLTLVFIGVLVGLVARGAAPGDPSVVTGYHACAGMLFASAVLMLLTASRTPMLAMKICPAIQTVAAVLLLFAAA